MIELETNDDIYADMAGLDGFVMQLLYRLVSAVEEHATSAELASLQGEIDAHQQAYRDLTGRALPRLVVGTEGRGIELVRQAG